MTKKLEGKTAVITQAMPLRLLWTTEPSTDY